MEERSHHGWGDLEGGFRMSQEKTEIQGIVEIGQKPVVARNATARGRLNLQLKTKAAIIGGAVSKGNVLEASTIAAIQAVKETPRIIPHCHPIPLEGTKVTWSWENNDLWCEVHVSAHYKTGIEMEALTGVAAGLLCAFDMVKSLEKDKDGQYPSTSISNLTVVDKFKGN
jgi:cyclic pyranopterin phosphate synthase